MENLDIIDSAANKSSSPAEPTELPNNGAVICYLSSMAKLGERGFRSSSPNPCVDKITGYYADVANQDG